MVAQGPKEGILSPFGKKEWIQSQINKFGYKNDKIMNLTEIKLYGTARAEILYFTLSMRSESGFGIPKV